MMIWNTLQQRAATAPLLNDLFAQDLQRFDKHAIHIPGMLADFSKNNIDDETKNLLLRLADEKGVEALRDRMFAGDSINASENRAVLHTRLRCGTDTTVLQTLARMTDFCDRIRADETVTDIVHIGIGGSYLGPEAVSIALAPLHHPRLKLHFASNVEPSALDRVLSRIDASRALFIIASKTFTTAETLMNARAAQAAGAKRFAAVTSNVQAASDFGIDDDAIFPMWDWVGGRYSVWSAVGLPVMLMIGASPFHEFLQGAHEMDTHFKNAPLEKNIPVMAALAGVWNRNFMGYGAYACIPYHAGLARLPAWLQQLDMESNGKPAPVKTGPVIFGEPGTDAQHSFFQLLHQGSDIIPVDFIAAVENPAPDNRNKTLLANCLAQSQALMTGHVNEQEPHRHFAGNRPSTTFLLDDLSPRTLGMLMAMYEHKIFVQGVIWGINSFDQWGVELGKVLAKNIEQKMTEKNASGADSSTNGLLAYILRMA